MPLSMLCRHCGYTWDIEFGAVKPGRSLECPQCLSTKIQSIPNPIEAPETWDALEAEVSRLTRLVVLVGAILTFLIILLLAI